MGNADARRPALSRALTGAAVVLGLVGLVLLVLGLVGQLSIATPNMRGFNPGQTISVGDSGMSVYARSDAAREEAFCTAGGDGSPVTLERPVAEFSVDVAGSDFFEVARTPSDFPAGAYAVSCEGTDQSVYAGPRATRTVATGIMGSAGLAVGSVLLGLALLMALLALLVRRDRSGTQQPGPYQYSSHAGSEGSTAYSAEQQGQGGYYPPPQGNPQPWYGQGERQSYGQQPYAQPHGEQGQPYGQGYGQQGQGYGEHDQQQERDDSEPDRPAYGDPPPPPPPHWREDDGTDERR